ncbi:GEgh16 protein [Hypoxylon sp. FL1150]|nr:GEgh16 protein [Hypoxylon sp. FL1150]
MPSLRQILAASALLAVAHGQGVILKAQGAKGSPASLGLQVDPNNTADANFISQTEIATNVVNECGRTLVAGNIDVGANTEDALAAGAVTQVTKGSTVQVTVREVNSTGAGPYTCDMDFTGNTAGTTGQVNVTTTESKADKNGDITIKVDMPANMTCIGASTGDVCTVRCRNANSFGGCFAVQQTDTTPAENTPHNIEAFQDLAGITAQVAQNNADLPAAVSALATSGSTDAEIGSAIVDGIQAADPATDGLTQEATASNSTGSTGTTTGNSSKGKGKGKGKKGKNQGNNNRRRRNSRRRV